MHTHLPVASATEQMHASSWQQAKIAQQQNQLQLTAIEESQRQLQRLQEQQLLLQQQQQQYEQQMLQQQQELEWQQKLLWQQIQMTSSGSLTATPTTGMGVAPLIAGELLNANHYHHDILPKDYMCPRRASDGQVSFLPPTTTLLSASASSYDIPIVTPAWQSGFATLPTRTSGGDGAPGSKSSHPRSAVQAVAPSETFPTDSTGSTSVDQPVSQTSTFSAETVFPKSAVTNEAPNVEAMATRDVAAASVSSFEFKVPLPPSQYEVRVTCFVHVNRVSVIIAI